METLEQSAKRVLLLQIVFAVGLAVLILLWVWLFSGLDAVKTLGLARAKSSLFGSLLGILATMVAARSIKRSSSAVLNNPYAGLLPVYAGLVFKLFIVGGGIYLGLVFFQLGPLFVVMGYIVMQAGYMWVAAKPVC